MSISVIEINTLRELKKQVIKANAEVIKNRGSLRAVKSVLSKRLISVFDKAKFGNDRIKELVSRIFNAVIKELYDEGPIFITKNPYNVKFMAFVARANHNSHNYSRLFASINRESMLSDGIFHALKPIGDLTGNSIKVSDIKLASKFQIELTFMILGIRCLFNKKLESNIFELYSNIE